MSRSSRDIAYTLPVQAPESFRHSNHAMHGKLWHHPFLGHIISNLEHGRLPLVVSTAGCSKIIENGQYRDAQNGNILCSTISGWNKSNAQKRDGTSCKPCGLDEARHDICGCSVHATITPVAAFIRPGIAEIDRTKVTLGDQYISRVDASASCLAAQRRYHSSDDTTMEKIDPVAAEHSASSEEGSLKEARVTETSPSPSITEQQAQHQKAVYRKVDFRILLWYSFVYLIMRIDVSNISNTAIVSVQSAQDVSASKSN